ERHPECLEVPLPAADVVGLAGPQLQEVARALGLTDQVEWPAVLLQDRPVGVVLADRRIDLEPARQLDEQPDVVALVQPASELALYLGVVGNVLVHRALYRQGVE